MHGAPGGTTSGQDTRARGVLRRLRTDDSGNVATGFLRVITLLAAFVAVAVVAGVLAAGLVLPSAAYILDVCDSGGISSSVGSSS